MDGVDSEVLTGATLGEVGRIRSDLHSMRAVFDDTVLVHPDRLALVTLERRFTFQELSSTLESLAESLSALGLENRARYLPLLVDRSVESHLALLTCLIYEIPFALIDGKSPRARLEQLWVLLGQPNRAWWGPSVDEGTIPWQTAEAKPLPVKPRGLVVTTSGSTGVPKGVEVSFHSHFARMTLRQLDLPSRYSSMAFFSPLYFTGGLGRLSDIIFGPTVYSIDPMSMDTNTLLHYLSDAGPDRITLPPQLGRLLSQYANPDGVTLPSVKLVRMGSEAIHYETLQGLRQYFSDDTVVRHGLGSTEAFGGCYHFFRLGDIPERGVVPLGQLGASAHLVPAPDMGSDVCELLIGGPIADGYLSDPEQTARRFVDLEGSRVWRSGDLVRLREDGQYIHVGRRDDIVKVRGMLASPSETTARLLDVEGIRGALTLPYRDGNNTRLVSFIESTTWTEPEMMTLRTLLADRLPAHLVPHDIITFETLPTSPRGKFDRQALLEHYRGLIQESHHR